MTAGTTLVIYDDIVIARTTDRYDFVGDLKNVEIPIRFDKLQDIGNVRQAITSSCLRPSLNLIFRWRLIRKAESRLLI